MFDFKKNAVVESLDDVPEKYQGLYAEGTGDDAGKFVIADHAAAIVADYLGTNESLTKARADKKTSSDESAKRRLALKEFEAIAEEFGIEVSEDTPLHDAIKARIAEAVAASKNGKELKVNLDKMKVDFEKRLAESLNAKDGELAKKDSALAKHLIGDMATRAITEAKGSADLLMPIVRDQCKVVQDGEDYVVRVVDAQGDFRSDGKGGFMGVTDLVAELKQSDNFARAFESESPGGGGKPPGSGNRASANKNEEKSSVQKISDGLARMKKSGVGTVGAGIS